MKRLLLAAALITANAFSVDTWTDGNGLTWTLLEVRTTHDRAKDRCHALGFEIPGPHDVLEALDYGLANEQINTVFGEKMKSVDWMWTNEVFQVVERVYTIVSRRGDTTAVNANERHWAVCAKRG